MRFRNRAKLDTTQVIDLRKRGIMSSPYPDPTPPTIGDSFETHAQTVVRAIIAVGAFSVISVAVVMGTADTIPSYFIGLAGIALGFFIGGGVTQVLKK